MLYCKNTKKKIININAKTYTFFSVLVATNKYLTTFAYIGYIKLNKNTLSQIKLFYKESYNIHKKEKNFFNIINDYYPTVLIKDNLFYKIIIIKYDYINPNYLFVKNIITPKNVVIGITHKQLNYIPSLYFMVSKNSFSNYINIYTLYKNYKHIELYYSYWNTLFNYEKYSFSFFKGILSSNKDSNYFSLSIKDITLGLISIEAVFEAKSLPNIYLVPNKLGILNNIFLLYEEATLNYLWKYNLYACTNNKTLFFTEITTSYSQVYENKTSIILPNNIITAGNYSINILLLKLFSHNLNYYTQDQSINLSHIFIFNIIVESLLKQYFKNGIIIPSVQFELIAKKMTSFVKINYVGDSTLLENDIFYFSKLKILNYALNLLGYKQLLYYPIVLGISKSVLAGSGFLASISFQEIIRYLIKLSIEDSTEWLTDLKSKIITTDLIETGSGWHRHFSKLKL